jgi:hypothetical protein
MPPEQDLYISKARRNSTNMPWGDVGYRLLSYSQTNPQNLKSMGQLSQKARLTGFRQYTQHLVFVKENFTKCWVSGRKSALNKWFDWGLD